MKTDDWKKPQPLPAGKFSTNVTPFKFGDRLHRKMFGRLNLRGNGRNARLKTHRDSRGVIWNGLPFYWSTKGYYRDGANGQRKPLHWQVWEQANGQCVPTMPRHVVVFLDGNKHNFAPENLALRSRAKIASQIQGLTPEQKRELMLRHWTAVKSGKKNWPNQYRWRAQKSRRFVAALLNSKTQTFKLKRSKR